MGNADVVGDQNTSQYSLSCHLLDRHGVIYGFHNGFSFHPGFVFIFHVSLFADAVQVLFSSTMRSIDDRQRAVS